MNACELCSTLGGVVLWQSEKLRVVRVDDPDYPGFCRVIWTDHVREMSDLPAVDRQTVMDAVFAVESAVRQLWQPDKINLASLGNMTPHLHWHIIPRWSDDPHFPQPIWGSRQRSEGLARPQVNNSTLASLLAQNLGPSAPGVSAT